MRTAVATASPARRADPRIIEHLREALDAKKGLRHPAPEEPTQGLEGDALLELSLQRGAVHEWIGQEKGPRGQVNEPGKRSNQLANWIPPLTIVAELASRALPTASALGPLVPQSLSPSLNILWIGRRCWPYGRTLVHGPHGEDRTLLERSIFVDAPDIGARLWAIDLALRCPAVSVVVADGSGFDMAATRRLALAAAAGNGLALLLRPPWEKKELSAATTRWLVRPQPSRQSSSDANFQGFRGRDFRGRGWSAELLRCKGLRPGAQAVGACVFLEADSAGAMRVLTDLGERLGEAALATARRVG